MTIVAFAGPSLPSSLRDAYHGVQWRPPAQAGDLLEFASGGLSKLCLIDGYFDHRPAVRHKEILLLLSRGVRVFGAASIGALRAAEMAPLGMVGIGAIFRAYARGTVVGDDEVALIHGPQEWDWRPLSVPLINVRATLCKGVSDHVLGCEDARGLLEAARALHYVDRTWDGVLEQSRLPARLKDWLTLNAVDQKRLDAVACLNAAVGNGQQERRPLPAMVMTPFVAALARERGEALPRG
jgi:hypothetical protein